VLHRDVKPENVLLDRFGESKLSDFGIAAVQDETTATTSITATIAHAGPEILSGARATVGSDLYSLGSTLHTLLTGRPAFVRDSDESFVPVAVRIANDPVPDLRPLGVPDVLAAAVEHAMAKAVADRPTSAASFAHTLQDAQRALGVPVTRTRAVELAEARPDADRTLGVDPPASPATPAPAPPPPPPPLPPVAPTPEPAEPAPLFAPGTRLGSGPSASPAVPAAPAAAAGAAASAAASAASTAAAAAPPPPGPPAAPVAVQAGRDALEHARVARARMEQARLEHARTERAPAAGAAAAGGTAGGSPARTERAPASDLTGPPRRRAGAVVVTAGVAVLVVAAAVAGAVLLLGGDDDDGTGPRSSTTAASTSPPASATVAATSPVTAASAEVDPAVEVLRAFPDRAGGSHLAGIAASPDGTLWVSDYLGHAVLHLSAATGEPVGEPLGPDQVGQQPARVLATGDDVWVVSSNDSLHHLRDGQWRTVDAVAHPFGLSAAVVDDGSVWVTGYGDNGPATDDGSAELLVRVSRDDEVVERAAVGSNPFSVAASGDDVYTANALDGTVRRVTSLTPTDDPVGDEPWDVLPAGDSVWVSSRGTKDGTAFLGGRLLQFDRAGFGEGAPKLTAEIDVGQEPRYLWQQPDGGPIWLTVYAGNRVVRVDPLTRAVDAFCLEAGANPNGITGDAGRVYVVAEGDGTIRTIPLDAKPLAQTCPAAGVATSAPA
jgi:streptogramin lyase